MYLPLQDQELVESFVCLDYIIGKLDLYDWLILEGFNLVVRAFADCVTSQVKLEHSFIGYLYSLIGDMLVAKPLACIVAVVHIWAYDVETLA